MAEIKMSYIFIEKQKRELKEMQEILLEVIDDSSTLQVGKEQMICHMM